MKKLMLIALAAFAAAVTGCKSIEVDRKAQSLATVQNADGTAQVVKDAAGNPIIPNLTQLVHTSLDGLTKLAVAVGEAYEKIAGGGAQASTVLKTSKNILEYFTSKGGDATKAEVSVDEAANTLKVSDGTTSIQCDSAGNCTTCADPVK